MTLYQNPWALHTTGHCKMPPAPRLSEKDAGVYFGQGSGASCTGDLPSVGTLAAAGIPFTAQGIATIREPFESMKHQPA